VEADVKLRLFVIQDEGCKPMIPFIHSFRLRVLVVVLSGVLSAGTTASVYSESTPDSKSEGPKSKEPPELKSKEPESKTAEPKAKEPEPTTKELELKLKELEQKVKELEPKAKEPDTKTKEPDTKAKDSEQKVKEPDAKPKEAEPRPKEAEVKPKESDAKPKDGTKAKEPEAKPKEAEPKPKEAEVKPKEPEVAEQPCPQVHPPADKPAADGQPPADRAPADKGKPAEAEGKKPPIRSPMVTAKLALMADSRLFPYDIEVDTKDKDLVLLGKVASDSEKRVATDIVRCLDGVHAVENRLKVEPDASHGLVVERDKIITNLVKERFEKSKTLQAVKFDVKTEEGIVTLTGATRFQVIILEAAQAARQVPGVKAVNTEAVRLVAGE
jgi:hyperosmotically inducible protein